MSSINPNNINGQYPIAGQDNDSQGFRDNFTNIKNNLTFAKSEIEALEQNAILKTALPGITLNNEMNNNQLKGVQLLRSTETIKDLATITQSTAVVNWADANFQLFTLAADTVLSFTGWPTSQLYAKLRLQVTVGATPRTLTFADTVINNDLVQGYSGGAITLTEGVYLFEFATYEGTSGTPTIYMQDLLRNYNTNDQLTVTGTVQLSGSEDLANAAAISLTTTASYFTTEAAETATLADGSEGQIKTLMAANVAAGDMVVTVTNAAWSGSGTITFDGDAQGCTLQYIDSKWFCVGNNGATFA